MLLDSLQSDLASAQKARDQIRVDTLRFLLGAVYSYQIDKYPPSAGESAGGLTDAEVLTIIAKQVKTHKESIEMFTVGKRQDLVDRETAELAILQSYLPAQMSDEEVRSKVKSIKESNPGADFGSLMKLAMAELKGKADGSLVANIIKEV